MPVLHHIRILEKFASVAYSNAKYLHFNLNVALKCLLNEFQFSIHRRLEQNFITEITPKAFSNFKRLRRIDLSNNNISRIAHDAFTGLKSLTTL